MIRRTILRLLGCVPLDEHIAARAEAELLRVQLEYAQAVIAILQAQQAAAPSVLWRVEREQKELN